MSLIQNEIQGKVKKNTRALVVMDEPDTIAEKVQFPDEIIAAVNASTWLTGIVPTVAVVTGHSATLKSKHALVALRTIGTAADRDVALNVTRLDLFCWKAFVQMTADANPVNAITIIESAGFKVRHSMVREKPILSAKKGSAPGSVMLIALAVARKASYDWEYSTDGQEWIRFDKSTPVAKTTMTGLKSGTIYYFRYRGNTAKVEGGWCDPVAFVRI